MMLKSSAPILLTLLFVVASSCATGERIPANRTAEVTLFAYQPTCPFEVRGTIEGRVATPNYAVRSSRIAVVERRMKDEARARGADGIVSFQIREVDLDPTNQPEYDYQGMLIVFEDETCKQ